MRADNTMLCIYINNVFVFIHTTYTDIVEVFRGDEDGMVILSWFFLVRSIIRRIIKRLLELWLKLQHSLKNQTLN